MEQLSTDQWEERSLMAGLRAWRLGTSDCYTLLQNKRKKDLEI